MEPEQMMRCAYKWHHTRGSPYPVDAVPVSCFEKRDKKRGLFRKCVDCRRDNLAHNKAFQANRRRRLEVDKAKVYCTRCSDEIDDDAEFKTCSTCRESVRVSYTQARKRVMLERIQEMGVCCELCGKVFLKNEDDFGFLVADSLDGVSVDQLELSNIDFDHLTPEEQFDMFGVSHGKKIQNLCQIAVYAVAKEEAKKCRLLCILCHVKETMRRTDHFPTYGYAHSFLEKRNYVNDRKMKIGVCELCEVPVDPDVLPYYDFDHRYDTGQEKVAPISTMCVNRLFTLDDIKTELGMCRLLCKFCHRVWHTMGP